jgi:hypothetical protein
MAAFDSLEPDPEKLQTFRTKIMRENKNVESAKRFDMKAWRTTKGSGSPREVQ